MEFRRKTRDLIQLYKIAKEIEEIELGVTTGTGIIARSHTN